MVHHDLWDYDVASQPTLFTWKDGTPAIVINTKMGHVFVLNRLTGVPLLPVESGRCRKAIFRASRAGRRSPFQPSLWCRRKFRPTMPGDQRPRMLAWCRDKIKASRWDGMFTPPSLQGTHGVSRQRGWRELGQRSLRSNAPYHGREHQSPHRLGQADSARQVQKPRNTSSKTTVSMANSESRKALPTGSIAPSCFLPAKRHATRRRGAPPKRWIFLPARRCGMFRWAR